MEITETVERMSLISPKNFLYTDSQDRSVSGFERCETTQVCDHLFSGPAARCEGDGRFSAAGSDRETRKIRKGFGQIRVRELPLGADIQLFADPSEAGLSLRLSPINTSIEQTDGHLAGFREHRDRDVREQSPIDV